MRMSLPPGVTFRAIGGAVDDLNRLHAAKEEPNGLRLRVTPQLRDALGAGSVLGYGIAEKLSGQAPTGTMCIRFYVRRKLPRDRLIKAGRIPAALLVQGRAAAKARIPTDVVTLPVLPTGHVDVAAGDSMGHFRGVEGTFGLAVRDQTSRHFALTCSHVAAPWWLYFTPEDGGEGRDPTGDVVESPADPLPTALHSIGRVSPLFARFQPQVAHIADAALVAPDNGVRLHNRILGLSSPPSFGTMTVADFANPALRSVRIFTKRGPVDGVIQSIHNRLPVPIFGRSFVFQSLVSYSALVDGGDSGSAVVSLATGRVLGIHMGGGPGFGLMSPAAAILELFGKASVNLSVLP